MSMWTYNSVYRAFINYYQQDLRNTSYTINISVIAIATVSPRVLVRLTLTDSQTNRNRQWITIIKGETISALTQCIKERVLPFRRQLEE